MKEKRQSKSYDELEFYDDFMFKRVMVFILQTKIQDLISKCRQDLRIVLENVLNFIRAIW